MTTRATFAEVPPVEPDEEDVIDVESEPAEGDEGGGSGSESWDNGVKALEAADAQEFLSEGYMAASAEAAKWFEQAAQELAEEDPAMAREAAEVAVRLQRFLSLDWGDPNQVVTSDMIEEPEEGPDAVVASGAPGQGGYPMHPPVAWFQSPGLTGPTPLTVTKEGRVFGHIALWGTCHTGIEAHTGKCQAPPRSNRDYSHFRTGAVLTAEGHEVAVGHLTLDTKHANQRLNAVRAAAHYDHTGHVAADVAVGEDNYGIWFSGALRPDIKETTVRALRSAPLSGDWRRIQGNLELVAVLGVNMPGFPVPRPHGLVASGFQQSLVASGMLPPKTVIKPGSPGALSNDDLRYLKSLADRERKHEADEMAAEVHLIKAERDVRAFAATRKAGQ